jgi:exopolysaccharide biosynthesis polyprenyl glycosylphosphotransferase
MATTVRLNHKAATEPGGSETPDQEPDPQAEISRAYLRAHRNMRGHGVRDAQRFFVLIAVDLSAFTALWWVLHGLRAGWLGVQPAAAVTGLFSPGFLGGWTKFAVALVLSLLIAGAYGAGQRRRDTGRVLAGVALAALISLFDAAWNQAFGLTLLRFTATVIVATPALVAMRIGVDRVVRAVRGGKPPSRAILVKHRGADVEAIEKELAGLREFTVVDRVRLTNDTRRALDDSLASLEDVIDRARADTVLLWTDLTPEEFAGAVDLALASGCRLLAAPRSAGVVGIQPKSVWVDGKSLVELTAPSLRAWQLAAKRAVDLVGSLLGLLVLSPVLIGIGVWIRLDSPGPALFSQRRVGARGRTFRMLKFRSMQEDAEARLAADPGLYRTFQEHGFKIPAELDPRLSRAGRMLRRTSLDELPQLLNVLAGSMSLVGPRPIEPVEFEHSGHHYGRHGVPVFLSVKPGMTGAWAVNGRSDVGYPDRALMELDYIRRWSLWFDLLILARTIPAVLQRRGAQ